ncbi:MAG: 4-hydroxythreonine-4-phosphate dehydrogenase [Chloroflexi bacterium]|nr:4-hydroxythreonine-4-phosphate dehydrogenase [Chloroflexota bacterium]
MAEFIFMLTHHDATVADALDVYEELRGTALRHVGFKDIGATKETLTELTRRMHEDGRTVYLEVVSVSAEDEIRSIRAAREIGVDVVMGGTHVDEALPLLSGSGIRYYPFPGRIVGHPSVLEGTTEEIAASAAALTGHDGVDGLDLLAYRHAGPVEPIIDAVVQASRGPVVVAGSIDSAERIEAVSKLGAWGFTIGGAAFESALPAEPTIRAQVEWALETAARAAARPSRAHDA